MHLKRWLSDHRPRRSRERARTWRLLALAVQAALLLAVLTSDAAHAHLVVAQAQSVHEVLGNLRNWLMGILTMLAVVFATIGGVRYVMAGGDPGEVERAKAAFKAAGIGFALAALAPLFVTVLQGIVGL